MKHRACEPRGFPGAAPRLWRVGRSGRRLATGRRALRRGRHQDFNKYFMWKARQGLYPNDVGCGPCRASVRGRGKRAADAERRARARRR
ncbi:hypothetical protein BVI2075_180058 [Burkholderia vietnamiensis]|nr:hypothetical protein BVI2075_180058 [Burkholderia vietnamiensis]